MPKSWQGERRRRKAKVPLGQKFATKGQLAKQMLQSLDQAGIRPAWFVADEVYSSNGSFWRWLEQTAKQPYLLTVSKQEPTAINFQTHLPKACPNASDAKTGTD